MNDKVAGSYRDPGGHVYVSNNRVYRTINSSRANDYQNMLNDQIIESSIDAGFLVHTRQADDALLAQHVNATYVLQHEKIPFISHPYEWAFYELKEAALHHLKFHLFLLERNYSLSDASAYNIQFIGHRPVFIDLLSIVPYQDGNLWIGYKQFFEQFLNPLLLTSLKGIYYNSWYRGTLEGISFSNLLSTLSWRQRLNWRVFTFIELYQRVENRIIVAPEKAVKKVAKRHKSLPKDSYVTMLKQLQHWITKLEPPFKNSVWKNYSDTNTYDDHERKTKSVFIREFVARNNIQTLADFGCNTGDYSIAALRGGAKYVIGFDFDHQALEIAYRRAKDSDLDFLPLWLDASNPSPDQGWLGSERESLTKRLNVDGIIALAFEHHLAIAKNIPIDQVILWLTSFANHGVIEFVPKDDPTVIRMLSTREDVFHDYTQQSFEASLLKSSTIINREVISRSGRTLYEYEKLIKF